MKTSNGSAGRPRQRTEAKRRAQLLSAFDRSGLSAAAFARQHQLNYTTFCGWRQRQAKGKAPPGFIQVEVAAPSAPVELLIELGVSARLRITSVAQVALAVRLLREFNPSTAC
jgi:hypothetical protein